MSGNGRRPDVDLTQIAREHPPRKVTIHTDQLDADTIGSGALMQVGKLLGISLAKVRYSPDDPATLPVAFALAWVILRRTEPDLSWEEVQGYNLVIVGAPEVAPAQADPPLPASSARTGA